MIDWTPVLIAVVAGFAPTILAISALISSIKNKRAIRKQVSDVAGVAMTAHKTANTVNRIEADAVRLRKDWAVKTAEFDAALKAQEKRITGFGPLDP